MFGEDKTSSVGKDRWLGAAAGGRRGSGVLER